MTLTPFPSASSALRRRDRRRGKKRRTQRELARRTPRFPSQSAPSRRSGGARVRAARITREARMIRKLLAEFVGTAWLVLGGCGSAVLAAAFPHLGIGFLGVALA